MKQVTQMQQIQNTNTEKVDKTRGSISLYPEQIQQMIEVGLEIKNIPNYFKYWVLTLKHQRTHVLQLTLQHQQSLALQYTPAWFAGNPSEECGHLSVCKLHEKHLN